MVTFQALLVAVVVCWRIEQIGRRNSTVGQRCKWIWTSTWFHGFLSDLLHQNFVSLKTLVWFLLNFGAQVLQSNHFVDLDALKFSLVDAKFLALGLGCFTALAFNQLLALLLLDCLLSKFVSSLLKFNNQVKWMKLPVQQSSFVRQLLLLLRPCHGIASIFLQPNSTNAVGFLVLWVASRGEHVHFPWNWWSWFRAHADRRLWLSWWSLPNCVVDSLLPFPF